jgi:hypothetical protein
MLAVSIVFRQYITCICAGVPCKKAPAHITFMFEMYIYLLVAFFVPFWLMLEKFIFLKKMLEKFKLTQW